MLNEAWLRYGEGHRRYIGGLDRHAFIQALSKGRFMNDCIPYLADIDGFSSEFDLRFPDGTPLLGHRADKLPREFTIVGKRRYEKLCNAIADCWEDPIFWNNATQNIGEPRDYVNLKELVSCNRKILPISAFGILKGGMKNSCEQAKFESIRLWKQSMQTCLYSESPHYSSLVSVDIKEFYKSIYVHAIEWALTGDKKFCKDHKSDNVYKRHSKSSMLNKSLMEFHDWQTNGIFVGNFASDFIAEIILCRVVRSLESKHIDRDFIGVRYKDDFKILCKNDEEASLLLKDLHKLLREFDLLAQEKDESYVSKNFSSLLFKKWKPEFLSIVRKTFRKEELLAVLYKIENTPDATKGSFWYEFGKFIRPFYRQKSQIKKIVVAWLIQWLKKNPNGTLAEMEYIYSMLASVRDPNYTKRILASLIEFVDSNHRDTGGHNFIVWFAFYLSLIAKKGLLKNGEVNQLLSQCGGTNDFVAFVISFLENRNASQLKKLRKSPIDSYY